MRGAQFWTTFSGNSQIQDRCQVIFAAATFKCLLFFPVSPIVEESVLELFVTHNVTVKNQVHCKHQGSFQGKAKAQGQIKDGMEETEEENIALEKASDCITTKTLVRKDGGAIVLNLKIHCVWRGM